MTCEHKRILAVSAKCSDCCGVTYGIKEVDGYVPSGLNIGGGDYIEFDLCLDCGVIVGDDLSFPITDEQVKEALER